MMTEAESRDYLSATFTTEQKLWKIKSATDNALHIYR